MVETGPLRALKIRACDSSNSDVFGSELKAPAFFR